MNRYSLTIRTKFGNGFDEWNFTVLAEDSKGYVKQVIIDSQKELKYESPVDLMDYVCDTYGWKWEDFTADIEIKM